MVSAGVTSHVSAATVIVWWCRLPDSITSSEVRLIFFLYVSVSSARLDLFNNL